MSTQPLGKQFEARVFEIKDQNVCVAFLSNHNTKDDVTLTFRGQPYFVPRHSISILADCKTVVFSTQHVRNKRSPGARSHVLSCIHRAWKNNDLTDVRCRPWPLTE
jgi:hypothetical protein